MPVNYLILNKCCKNTRAINLTEESLPDFFMDLSGDLIQICEGKQDVKKQKNCVWNHICGIIYLYCTLGDSIAADSPGKHNIMLALAIAAGFIVLKNDKREKN